MSVDLSRYRNGYMFDPATMTKERDRRSCRHLGESDGGTIEVPGCCGTAIRVSVRTCYIHGQCSPEAAIDGEAAAAAGVPPIICCRKCSDYEAKTVEAP